MNEKLLSSELVAFDAFLKKMSTKSAFANVLNAPKLIGSHIWATSNIDN